MRRKTSIAAVGLMLIGMSSIAYAQNSMSVIADFYGEHHSSNYGKSMASLDFNHDGCVDLVISSPGYGYIYPGTTSPSRGKIYIYNGGAGLNSYTSASLTLEGTYDGSSGTKIWAIYPVGDVSGDGFEDLCIYVEDVGESEKLLFFYGGTTDLNNPNYVIDISDIYFYQLFALGDFNGDGFEDIGMRYEPIGQLNLKLSIVWGGSFIEYIVSEGEGDAGYTASINGIGDINNDGYADFTTGFTNPDPYTGFHLIRLYYGNDQGNTSNPDVFIQTQYAITKVSKPLGDMNGDGYDDFMGYVSTNGMHVWLGGQNINYTVPSFNFSPAWYGGAQTKSLEYGDFNGDGYSDVVGANYSQSRAAIWLGKQHVNGTSDLTVSQNREYFGYSVATGDFNTDGYDDIAIAASHQYDPMPSGTFYGFVWVYGGNAQMADTTVANDDPTAPGLANLMQVIISPNPVSAATGMINVRIIGSEHSYPQQDKIEVFNIKGQSIFTKQILQTSKTTTHSIDLPQLPNGVYLCRVSLGKSALVSRFIITK
jgi:hypothetical protein